MLRPIPSSGYSAEVRMELLVDGQRLPVAQVGGGQLIFDRPVSLPNLDGQLIIHIDGHEHRWRVTPKLHPQPSRVIEAELEPD